MAIGCLRWWLGMLVIVAAFGCLCVGRIAAAVEKPYDTARFNRSNFPEGFVFGTSSAAYQYEGAAWEDGKGPSIWDYYTHKYPGKIADGSNGDVAVDQYHRFKDDIIIMKNMGLDAYRFSISWSRVLPKGTLRGGINQAGIDYYNNLIDGLLASGIQPYITLFHWDLPLSLQDEYGGFLSDRVVEDYKDYTELCFRKFGDRVKHWITLNEPYVFSYFGYATGFLAPGRCSAWQNLNCTGGDSGTEPYIVFHNLILAHATAVGLYKEKYQASQKGIIGVTLNSNWVVPHSDTKADRRAARRMLDFLLGWFLNPITYGGYPKTMRSLVGKRLPEFTEDQVKLINGSYDFIGINYYTSNYATPAPRSNGPPSVTTDSQTNQTSERNGVPIGTSSAASSWIYVYPQGIRELLLYIKRHYANPIIYITENGMYEANNATLPLEKQLADETRINYYYWHLRYLKKVIGEGARVKGFFAWSFLDNLEWTSGFSSRFGINYVDYENGLKRYPKQSAFWFTDFLKKP